MLPLLFYFSSFLLFIINILPIVRRKLVVSILFIAQCLLIANILLFASYTLYGRDVYIEYYAITNTIIEGKIDFQNIFASALYNSVLVPVVCIVTGTNPLFFYKILYIFFIGFQVPILYIILNKLCKNKTGLKLSMIFSTLIPLWGYASSIRFGIAVTSFLLLIMLVINMSIKKHATFSDYLMLLLLSSSLPLCYYTLGVISLILLLLLWYISLVFQEKGSKLNVLLLSVVIASVTSILYFLYISTTTSTSILHSINTLIHYPSIAGERIGYTIKGNSYTYYIRSLIQYLPYAIATLGIILELSTLIYKKAIKQLTSYYYENVTLIFTWLIISLVINMVLAFTRTGFVFLLIIFNPLFTLGIYNIYSILFSKFSKSKVKNFLIISLAVILLITQFLGSTRLVDTLLKVDTSSPVLDIKSVYRSDATEIFDYYMLKYLLTSFPSSDFRSLYSDMKIANSIVSVASDLYPKPFSYKPIDININPYALTTFLKDKNIKGILILSSYNILTGRAIVPQGTINIHLNDILGNYNLVYNGFSLILSRD
jgi:hypothetical protein